MARDFAEGSSLNSCSCEAGVPQWSVSHRGCLYVKTAIVVAHLEAPPHHAHELPKYQFLEESLKRKPDISARNKKENENSEKGVILKRN